MGAEIERLKWRISTLETVETECTRALAALAASEARYRRLLDEAGFPITITTAQEATILFANPLACQLFGLEGSRPQGRRMLEFYPNPAERAALVERLRSQSVVRDQEVLMLDGAGHSRTVLITASLITFEGQEAVLATSNDITDRRHAEALFRSVVESSPDGIGITELGGTITYASPRLVQIFGHQRAEEMLGRNLREFVVEEEHGRMEDRLRAVLGSEPSGPSEWTGLRPDGSTFPQETNGEVLRNPDGSPGSFFFIIRDLSNRKRLERAIRWGEKLESLGLMAAGIAHELNNAFQVTHGNLELAQELCPGKADLTELLSGIGMGVDRAALLAKEMLAYSGQTLREEASISVERLVKETLALQQERVQTDLRLAFSVEEELPAIHGDEGQVMKVLSAFVSNAIEAMDGRAGTIHVRAEALELAAEDMENGFWAVPGRQERFLRLQVGDSGVGIPPGLTERICDPFFTTKGSGRGLGLSVALGILRAHSACFQILSQPGEGTTMRAYFPLTHGTPPHVLPEGTKGSLPQGILVAEDDDGIRDLVVGMLHKWGYAPVFAAKHGLEALRLFEAHADEIGLLLTDASMPQMNGPEAFVAMRKLRPSLRSVLMTGYSETFGQGTAAAFGFTSFLQKPFKFMDLKARLKAVRSGGENAEA